MSLLIELDPEVEARLQQEAAQQGVEPAEFARRLIEHGLLPVPLTEKQRAAMELLRSWSQEDATDDPEAIRAAEEEWEALKQALNENRRLAGERLLFP